MTLTVAPRKALLALTAAIVFGGAGAGAALGAWGVDVQTAPAGEVRNETVTVSLFGRILTKQVRPRSEEWGRWSQGVRAALGGMFGAALGLVAGVRRTRAVGLRTYTVLEGLRGGAVGGLAGVAVCGAGFALLGAIVCAMLEEPGWTLGEALARGARLGGPPGILLGVIAGTVIGSLTAVAGAPKRYFAGRPGGA
jgi:hypothetical protein